MPRTTTDHPELIYNVDVSNNARLIEDKLVCDDLAIHGAPQTIRDLSACLECLAQVAHEKTEGHGEDCDCRLCTAANYLRWAEELYAEECKELSGYYRDCGGPDEDFGD